MTVTNTSTAIYGRYEPSLDYQFLPGCRECGGSHPLARKPVPANTDICPDCGVQAGTPGEVKTERAGFRLSPKIAFAQACLWTARQLSYLHKRL